MTHLPDSDLRELEGLVERAGVGRWRWIDIEQGIKANGPGATLLIKAMNALPSLIADLREARERIGWQPIETAPRDGTYVDLWAVHPGYPANTGYRVPEGVWIENPPQKGRQTGWFVEDDRDSGDGLLTIEETSVGRRPTHWMPLPDAPARIKELERKT